MDLQELTITSFARGLREKTFSALEITEAFLERIAGSDTTIGAYLDVYGEDARVTAAGVDHLRARGVPLPPLAGVPISLKDNLMMQGKRVTAGSKILERYIGTYDATVVRKLISGHVVILGKTNLDEFAMGASTENSAFQTTKNPYDRSRVPGGSSGGSAAAIAGGMTLGALGSDTGGSVRQPAAFCGIVGLKPTYGAVSRFGLISMASSLDQIGPLARTVEDAALIFDAIKGRDPMDATSVDKDFGLLSGRHPSDVTKLTIGIPDEYFGAGLDPQVAKGMDEVIARLAEIGFKFKNISLPHTKYALSAYYIIMPAEVSANLARFDGVRYLGIPEVEEQVSKLKDLYFKTRGRGFGREARRRVLLGTFVLSAGYYDAYYTKAQKVRRLITEDFTKAFSPSADGVDVILAPTTPTPAFKIGEKMKDPLSMYLSDIFTVTANLAGLPAISIPVKQYHPEGKELPVGFQLIGNRFREADILGIGALYEQGR